MARSEKHLPYFVDHHPRHGWRVIDRYDGMTVCWFDAESEAEVYAARINDPNFDGAPDEVDTAGPSSAERYTSAQRRDLRDAGRRHWDA